MSNKDRFQLVGNTIAGTFRVDEVVAEGGFGVVYRAYHMHFRSPVALKCLKIPAELSEEERQTFLEQFRSEAEIQFRLSAALPHIVRPLHVDAVQSGSGEFVPLMALEWLDGQSFEKIIEHRTFADMPPMPLAEAMELIGPAAQALHEAHHFRVGDEVLSVVHRDIKPDNFFVTEIGGKKTVKLLDFGISKVRRAATQLAGHFSQTSGQAPFSPAYGAPEQWVPKRFGQTGPWTDVWGIALTLVEIIKGDAVIVGDHQAMMGTVLDPKVRPSPRSEGVSVSDEVESVFLKALSVDPRYRYQSIRAFWEALSAAVDLSSATRIEETPSGRRLALPRMSAPTPWTPPHQRVQLAEADAHLPPMLAPAPLEPTPESQLDPIAYPSNPHSDLHPVPAAPNSWDQTKVEIAPIFDPEERELAEGSPRKGRITHRQQPSSQSGSAMSIELANTSSFPLTMAEDEAHDVAAPDVLPPAALDHRDTYVPPALGGFSLPPSVRSGAPVVSRRPRQEAPEPRTQKHSEALPSHEMARRPGPPPPPRRSTTAPAPNHPTAGPSAAPRDPAPRDPARRDPAPRDRASPDRPGRSPRRGSVADAPSAAGPPPAPSRRAKQAALPPIPDLEGPWSGQASAARSSGPAPRPPRAPPRPVREPREAQGAEGNDESEGDARFSLTPAHRHRGMGSH